MPNGYDTTTKWKVDVSDLKKSIQEANRQIKLANAEFKAATAGMDDWGKSADGISAKLTSLKKTLDAQKSVLNSYEKQLEDIEKQYGENSKEADAMRIKVLNQEAAVKRTEKSIKDFEGQLESLNDAQSDAAKSTEKQADAYEDLQSTIKTQEKNLDELKGKYKAVVLEQGKNSKAADDLAKEIKDLSGELSENKDKLKEVESAADGFDDALEDAAESAKASEGSFSVLKGAMANLVAEGINKVIQGLKDMASAAYEAWQSYDEGADAIIAATGATGKDAEELQAVYDNVSKTVLGDFNDIGTAIGEVNTRFGLTGSDLEKTSEKFLKFAEINGTDVKSSVDDVQSAMAAFGIEAEDAGSLLDVLNKAGQDTGVNVSELTKLLVANAPALQEMGYNAADAADFMANLSKDGIDTSATMAGLKKALVEASKEGKPMSEALAEIENSIVNAKSESEAISASISLFGSKAGPQIAKAVKSGRLQFDKFGKSLKSFDGNIETTYDAMLDGPDEINLAMQNMRVEAAKVFDDFLQKNGPAIKAFLDDFTTNTLPKIADALSAAADAAGWFIDNLPTIIGLLGSVAAGVAAYVAYTTAIKVMKEGWMALEVVQKAVTAAQWLMNAALSANPIGLVVAAVAALVAGFITLWNTSEEFREFWIGLWEKIKEVAGQAWEGIKAIWAVVSSWFKTNIIEPLGRFFSGMWGNLKNGAKNAWEGIKNAFAGVAEWFGSIFSKAWQKVKDVFSTGGKIFSGIKEGIENAFKTVVNAIIRGINKIISLPFNKINQMLAKIRDISILGAQPFKNIISTFDVPQIPELAKGGVLAKGQIGLLEGDGAEAVVPLHQNKRWINAVAADLRNALQSQGIVASGRNSSVNYNFVQNNTSPKALSRLEIYRQTKNQLNFAKGV